jgi:acetyltransferase-like isoleucine patch superfamily enzyme
MQKKLKLKMIKSLFQKLLIKSGKDYEIDARIPEGLFLCILVKRALMATRGMVFLRKKVYLAGNCKILNKNNFVFGKGVTIERHTVLDGYALKKIRLGDCVKIGAFSTLTTTSHLSKYGVGLTMGNYSAIGDYTHFGASGGIDIGNDVIMGSYISFHSENHNFNDNTKLIREQGVTSKGIRLGNNIWVGAKVTFLDGSVIGNNSVIAAGAVVNGIFPDNVLIGGVPAKILKSLDND